MLELTFDPSFARMLAHHHQFNVLALPPDLQFGDLRRLTSTHAAFYEFKARQLGLGRHSSPDAESLQAADLAAITQLKAAIHTNTPMRIWWSDIPNDVIGLWWLADLCAQQQLFLQQVHVPTVFPHPTQSALSSITHLGELDPDWITGLLQITAELTVRDLTAYAAGWQYLQSAPNDVRVLLNGDLLSVPETYFDPLILAKVTTPPKSSSERVKTIGRLIGAYQIDIPDWWWHYRLQQLFN